ncbi:uncharacterized protein KD926_009741 [Aspergillus affinis]|uniref:uncharacterized protein n=1 Tax=Aspergillus affinis TaxID=1070780 RepID=UPI0022FE2772|nr:uncharacterized protein KD926_009741 [Aspergillus affinis]KAI9039299.1 hypothetical protein KD926_009741 [Aspergillus affinis]
MSTSDFSSPALSASTGGKVEDDDRAIAVIPASTPPPAEIITQASRLPTRLDTRLPRIEKLWDFEDWSFWIRRVKCALELLDLTDLVDLSISRPAPDDRDYEKWRRAAKAVRFWLLNNISKDIFMKVMDSPKPNTWPDDLLKLIKSVVLSDPREIMDRVVEISRSDFGSIPEFVKALQDRVRLSIDADVAVSPYRACRILLDGINDEMPDYAEAALVELHSEDDEVDDLSWARFTKLCRSTLRIMKMMGLTPVASKSSSKASSRRAKKFN